MPDEPKWLVHPWEKYDPQRTSLPQLAWLGFRPRFTPAPACFDVPKRWLPDFDPQRPDWSAVRRVLMLHPFDLRPGEFESLFAKDAVAFLESKQPQVKGAPPSPATTGRDQELDDVMTLDQAAALTGELTGEEKALALLVGHSGWSDTRIAKAVPCSRTTLYKWQRYRNARKALEANRDRLPKGSKDGETGNVEAWWNE